MDPEIWHEEHGVTPLKLETARLVLADVLSGSEVMAAIRRHPIPGGGHIAKTVLVALYRQMLEDGELQPNPALLERIRMKPVRSLSGVTTVTVLTKPAPCPGKCIFCPTEVCMPKSYLPDEPGAARAFQNNFDPYKQVASRLESYRAVGHPIDKIELLILGGTWSAYPRDYQEWFVRRCFDVLNGTDSDTLEQAHLLNETASYRNVGLVIETRPDKITPDELAWLRRLGVTKVQLGAQSLDDTILMRNHRGHSSAVTLQAVALLRAGAFKVVLHWMPNLLGATPASDRLDFARLWQGYCPDELKIYPTQLLETAELYQVWQRGEYQPYDTPTLIDLVADIKATIPEYCRVNRIIRDIPSQHVVAGNKRSSLRQDAMAEMARRGTACRCIRCREVRGQGVESASLEMKDLSYAAAHSQEHFLSFVTPDDHLAGYLRLTLPTTQTPDLGFSDLKNAAMIREVHIYGQSLAIGREKAGAAQHSGLGTRLLLHADEIARQAGYQRMAVIAAIGTRQYYQNRGFERGNLYMVKDL
jgi:elongator complex protein 3